MSALALTAEALAEWERNLAAGPLFSGLRAVKHADLLALVHDARVARLRADMSTTDQAVFGADAASGKDRAVFWAVGDPIKCGTRDLARAVFSSDQCPSVFSHELPQVHSFVNLTMRQLALCCLGGHSVELYLDNGYLLRCVVEQTPAAGSDR